MGWHTANQAVADHTDPEIDDEGRLGGVCAIGVDEKRFLNATPDRRTVFTTQIVDLEGGRLLDVVEGRSRHVLSRWLAERGVEWCAGIRLATLDPSAGYRAALDQHLPDATLPNRHDEPAGVVGCRAWKHAASGGPGPSSVSSAWAP